jgi:hypothetical protein
MTKAAEAKAKAAAKKKAVAKKGKKGDDDGDYSDEDGDEYNALSKALWKNSTFRPQNGAFCDCAKCAQQFTVVRPFPLFTGWLASESLTRRLSTPWPRPTGLASSATSARRQAVRTPSRSRPNLRHGNARLARS